MTSRYKPRNSVDSDDDDITNNVKIKKQLSGVADDDNASISSEPELDEEKFAEYKKAYRIVHGKQSSGGKFRSYLIKITFISLIFVF